MANSVEASAVLKSGWDFLSKHINKLWPVAILLALPTILSAFSTRNVKKTEFKYENLTDFSSFTESVFGVSAATFGAAILLFLFVSIIYSAFVYSGSLKLMLKSLRGHTTEFKLGDIFRVGRKYLGRFVLLTIAGGVIIFLGFLLLIIPGLIAIFLLSLALHFMVDKDLGVSESLSSSYRTIKSNASSVFMVYLGLILVGLVVSIAGSILFGANTWFTRVLSAGLDGFVSLYGLIVVTKLYLALIGKTAPK